MREARRRGSRGAAVVVGTLGGVAALVLEGWGLSRIPNDPESFDIEMPWLERALWVGAALLTASVVAGWKSGQAKVRLAAKVTGVAAVATALLWNAPVPFAPQRLLVVPALLVGAGLFALAGLRTGVAEMRSAERAPAPAWAGLAAVGGMVSAGSVGMLLLKINAIAWEHAID